MPLITRGHATSSYLPTRQGTLSSYVTVFYKINYSYLEYISLLRISLNHIGQVDLELINFWK